jgi:hypothetical protein
VGKPADEIGSIVEAYRQLSGLGYRINTGKLGLAICKEMSWLTATRSGLKRYEEESLTFFFSVPGAPGSGLE